MPKPIYYRIEKNGKFLSFTSGYTASGKMRVVWTKHGSGTLFTTKALADSWAAKYNGKVVEKVPRFGESAVKREGKSVRYD